MWPPKGKAPAVVQTASAQVREKQDRPAGHRQSATLGTRGARIRTANECSSGQSFSTVKRLDRAGLLHDPEAIAEAIEKAYRRGFAQAVSAAAAVVREGFDCPAQLDEWRLRVDQWRYAQVGAWQERRHQRWVCPPDPYLVDGQWKVVGEGQNPARLRAVKGGGK